MSAAIEAVRSGRRAPTWIRGFGALARMEWRGLCAMACGLAILAIVALGIARFGAGVNLPVGGRGHSSLVLALTMAALLPMTAEALEGDWRRGTARLLGSAPVRRSQLLSAKAVAVLAHAVLFFAVVSALDGLLAAAFVSAEAKGDATTAIFDWPQLRLAALVLGWIGVTVTALVAIVARHALAATIAGALVAVLPGLLGAFNGESVMTHWLTPHGFGVSVVPGLVALACAATVALVSACYALRGRGARQVWRRALRGGLAVGVMAAAPVAIQLGLYLTSSAPRFDDPHIRFSYGCEVSPDGGRALLEAYSFDYRGHRPRAAWVLDTETLEVEELPSAVRRLRPWSSFMWSEFASSWAFDGRGVLTMAESSWQRNGAAAALLDLDSGAAEAIRTEDFTRLNERGGWTWEYSGTDGYAQVSSATTDGGKRFELPNVYYPRVPKLAPHLLFYVTQDFRIRRLDARTGEDVPVTEGGRGGLNVSPKGEWLDLPGPTSKRRLVHVASGRSRSGVNAAHPMDGEFPLLTHGERPTASWTLVGIEDEKPLELAKRTSWLKPFPGERWIGADGHGGLWIFRGDGGLVKELHPSSDEGGR